MSQECWKVFHCLQNWLISSWTLSIFNFTMSKHHNMNMFFKINLVRYSNSLTFDISFHICFGSTRSAGKCFRRKSKPLAQNRGSARSELLLWKWNSVLSLSPSRPSISILAHQDSKALQDKPLTKKSFWENPVVLMGVYSQASPCNSQGSQVGKTADGFASLVVCIL